MRVEVIAALGEKVKKVQGKDPDLVLDFGDKKQKIELKGGSKFPKSWIKKGINQYSDVPCLFLYNGNYREKFEELRSENSVNMLNYSILKDEKNVGNVWILGLAEST